MKWFSAVSTLSLTKATLGIGDGEAEMEVRREMVNVNLYQTAMVSFLM